MVTEDARRFGYRATLEGFNFLQYGSAPVYRRSERGWTVQLHIDSQTSVVDVTTSPHDSLNDACREALGALEDAGLGPTEIDPV